MELKIRFEEIQGERDLKDITDLDLEKVKAQNFEGLPDELPEVLIINASGLGLENLNGLPNLPKLHTIDLSENKLTGAVLGKIGEKCPVLEQLNLCGNAITDIEGLNNLLNIKSLLTLDLLENEVTKTEDYREKVFELFPNLRYLDGYDRNNEEIDIGSLASGESAELIEDEDEEDDEEEVGLSYLDSSKCLEEEDDSPDFEEKLSRKRKNEGKDVEESAEKQPRKAE